MPELEAILSAVVAMHRLVLASERAPAEQLGEKAFSVRAGVANWWARDHVSILDRGYDWGLFTAAVGICVLAGVVPSAIAAILVKPWRF